MQSPRTIIIGAGLSGLCLAHALLQHGIDIAVFERDIGPEVRGQGYRLTIDATGSNALRACVPTSIYEFIRATAGKSGKTGAFIFLDENARELHRFIFDTEASERLGHVTGQVDRRTLRQALLSGIRGHVQFGKAFLRYEELPSGVAAHFADGSSTQADILVGADGTNSAVRQQRLPHAEPQSTGIYAVFGRTPLANLGLRILGSFLSQGGMMALGPDGIVFFCTTMRFRERPEVVAERLGLEFSSAPSDYVMWAVAARKWASDRAEEARDDPAALHQIALHEIREFYQDYKTLVQNADPTDTVLVPIRATPRLKAGGLKRVTLIGDAAHTMPPYGAHGANTALRDAQTLATSLLSDGQHSHSLEHKIAAYESQMREYSQTAVRSAVRMMSLATASFPLKQLVFRTALRLASAFSH